MKMTERDKMLLILLAVILIVALAIVVPGYGVMDTREKIQKTKDSISELDGELDDQLAELMSMGVSAGAADNPYLAQKNLETEIHKRKEEAARLPENILEYSKNFSVNDDWLRGLEYRSGYRSTGYEDEEGEVQDDKILNISITGGQNGVENSDFLLGDKYIKLNFVRRTVESTVANGAECAYTPNDPEKDEDSMIFESYRMSSEEFGAILLYLEHLSAKGAILIDGFKTSSDSYSTEEGELTRNLYEISIRVMMTDNNGISKYADEINAEETEGETGE